MHLQRDDIRGKLLPGAEECSTCAILMDGKACRSGICNYGLYKMIQQFGRIEHERFLNA